MNPNLFMFSQAFENTIRTHRPLLSSILVSAADESKPDWRKFLGFLHSASVAVSFEPCRAAHPKIKSKATLVIVDDDSGGGKLLQIASFSRAGYAVETFADARARFRG
jgi:hypothetical protein